MASARITSLYTVMASFILLLGLAVAAPTRATSPHVRQSRQADTVADKNVTAAYLIADDYLDEVGLPP